MYHSQVSLRNRHSKILLWLLSITLSLSVYFTVFSIQLKCYRKQKIRLIFFFTLLKGIPSNSVFCIKKWPFAFPILVQFTSPLLDQMALQPFLRTCCLQCGIGKALRFYLSQNESKQLTSSHISTQIAHPCTPTMISYSLAKQARMGFTQDLSCHTMIATI